jgi:hypothetical protein
MFYWLMLAIVLATFYAFDAKLREATLLFGKRLAPEMGGRGLQDAITPPWQTVFAAALLLITLGLIVSAFLVEGMGAGLAVLASWFISRIVVGAVLSAQTPNLINSQYTKIILYSLANRSADYAKKNDMIRSDLAKRLYDAVFLEWFDEAELPT